MLGPTRAFLTLRRNADSGVLAAVAAVAATFSATPFLIPVISEEYDVSLGQAGLLSTAQVGAFALVVFVAGRTLKTDRRLLVAGATMAAGVNIASAFAPGFGALVGLRIAAGGAAGILVWLGWAKAMRLSGAMRNVAAAGPLTVLISAPVVGTLADSGGSRAVFLLLAATSIPAAVLPADFVGYRHERRRMSPSRSNVILVVMMGVMTMAGSSLFVFGASIGAELELDPLVVSFVFSGNAAAGFVAARQTSTGRSGGIWILGIAASAAAVGFSNNQLLFVVGLIFWGFCFWMATPRILASIAAWSLAPDERVGDTQSAMATGRAVGPAAGALMVGDGSFTGLAGFAVIGLVVSGLAVLGVSSYRRRSPIEPASTSA